MPCFLNRSYAPAAAAKAALARGFLRRRKMRFKLLVPPILTVGLLLAAVPAFSQVLAPYQGTGLPITIGAGASSWDPDWGQGRMLGITAWADWYPTQLPPSLRGLGLEVEGRDVRYDRHLQPGNGDPARSGQGNTTEDTIGGGPIYTWRHFKKIQPYAKGIFSIGSVDFISPSPTYSHDTRTVMAAGGGLQYRVFGPLWARADYEYQDWGQLLGTNLLEPQGFTFGISFDFSHPAQP
jgi:opacity protein-like surface antigen